jgi:hypothetical protein
MDFKRETNSEMTTFLSNDGELESTSNFGRFLKTSLDSSSKLTL